MCFLCVLWCLWPWNTSKFLKASIDIFIHCLVPEWSLNDKADVWPGTYFICVSGSDWVAWKDRVTQQRGNQSIPQTQWSTCTRKHWEQIMPIQSSCFLQCLSCVHAGKKRGQWLECHPGENWTKWELIHESKQTVVSWHRQCLLEVPLQIFHRCGYWRWRG